MKSVSPSARRLAIVAGLFVAALMSCGREVTGPASGPANILRRLASVAFDPRYEIALKNSALQSALAQVAFERVRITLRDDDGEIALDTVVTFPAGADSLTLSLHLLLPADAPASGLPYTVNLGYVNAAGDTVFKGGPLAVNVVPSGGSGSPPPPVRVSVRYTGTGANAASVVIAPKTLSGFAGQSASFSAQALGLAGSPIPGTPIVFSSSDAGVVRIGSPSSGTADLVGRGTARVYAQLLTGQIDSATVTVILPATRIELKSGAAQTASAGTALPQPVVARVLAADGIGVPGVTVAFAVTSGGGSVTPASALTTADGSVSATWTLGGTAGEQAMSITSSGLTGSPLAVSATALPVVASKLVITTGPVSTKAGSPIGAVVVAQDALGNTATSFGGDVTVSIGANPGNATLGGTTTTKAVNGVATFSGLMLDRPGTGYTLTFSAPSLTSATSTKFDILVGEATKLAFGRMPASVDVGLPIVPPVQVLAQDASGNTVTTFTGSVTLAIGSNAGASTLSGTLTRTAVAGVATFNDLALNRKGPGYTLVASSTGLTGATSAAFNATPGEPTAISIVSGGGQTAAAGALLAPIVLQLHDALGNGLEGVTIALAVATGGGSLAATSLVTDANGKVTVAWRLGGSGGAQSITASAVGVPTATITATATGATGIAYTWVGRAGALWSTASSWSPAGVPGPNDEVTIGVEVTATLSANTSVHNMTLQIGEVALGPYDLTVSGNVNGDSYSFTSGTGALRITGAGAHSLALPSVSALYVDTAAVVTLAGNVHVLGDANVGGRLAPNGHSLTVGGSLNVLAKGGLKMTQALDSVLTWNASFAGVASDTLLTNGVLVISNGFVQSGGLRSFAPSGSHVTSLWAEGYTMPALRAIRTGQGNQPSRPSRASRSAPRSRLQSASEVVVAGGRRRFVSDNLISFANPGYAASHFNILEIDPKYDIALGSDVYATRSQVVGSPNVWLSSATGTQLRLVQKGASLGHLTFDRVTVQIDVGGTFDKFKAITFTNQDTTADQFVLSRNGGAITLDTVVFDTKPGPLGHYVKLIDGPSPFTVTFTRVTPPMHGGRVAIVGSSSFTNWPAGAVWLGESTTWTDTLNWNTHAVPDSTVDVIIPSSAPNFPVFGYGATDPSMHNLKLEPGATIDLGCYANFNVYGNVVAPLDADATPGRSCEGNGIYLRGDGASFNTIVGNFSVVYVKAKYRISGTGNQLIVNDELTIDGVYGPADLTVNGGRLDVGDAGGTAAGTLYTRDGGTLTMTNAADLVFVFGGGAHFYGGSTAGLLTTGRLSINNGSLQLCSACGSAAGAYAPSGTHTTTFTGASNYVTFDTLTSSFFQNADVASGSSVYFESGVAVRGTLAHVGGTGIAALSGNVGSLLTVSGISQTGASTPMTIAGLALKFVDGAPAAFSNVSFSGFASFSGAVLEFARTSGGPYTFSALDFSAVTGLVTPGVYVKNSGTQALNILSSVPSPGVSGTHYLNTGTGSITWP